MSATNSAATLRESRLRAWYVWGRQLVGRVPMSLILLAMRFGIGGIFFNSGLIKLRSFEFAVKLFQDEYKLPLLDPVFAARLAAFSEITFPLFLFAGLATRFAAVPLLFMTVVIFYTYPDSWNESLVWGSLLVTLITRGGGVFSLDYLIERYFRGKG
jgi:putative oxidoreductase